MINREYAILDVFTDTPLQGNPLAVFLDSLDLDGELMQRTAAELNLSETVFLGPLDRSPAPGAPHAAMRIFTPRQEMPFAGHPVLGTAFVVRDQLGGGDLTVRLRPPAGEVPIVFTGEGSGALGEMEQPLPVAVEVSDAAAILTALGVRDPLDGPVAYCNGPTHTFVELASAGELAELRPDLGRLARIGGVGFIVFAATGRQSRYRCRMFAPGAGVNEDPATGSAAGPLAAHLVLHGRERSGARLAIEQGVEMGRPSLLLARADADHVAAAGPLEVRRVRVAGNAVIVARGRYLLS